MNKVLFTLGLLFFSACSTCKGTIGVIYHPVNHDIEYVFEDSPAEKLGLKEGDKLLLPHTIRGDVGDKIRVRVQRGKEILIFDDVELKCNKLVRKEWK